MQVKVEALLLFALLLLPFLASAQQPPEAAYPYRRDIEKFKFDRAEQKLFKHLDRDSNSLEFNYAAYRLYSTPAFARYNPDSAYLHLVIAYRIFDAAESKMIQRWARDSYSGALFSYSLRRISSMALADAHTRNSPDAYRHFIEFYTLAPDDIRDSAICYRDTIEYAIAQRSGTIQMIEDFISRRPQSTLVATAVRHRDSMAFDEANSQHTVAAYNRFCITYPHSHLLNRATDSLYLLEFHATRSHDSEQYYRTYAQRYPLSPYAKQAVWFADSIQYKRQVNTSQWFSFVHYIDLHHGNSWCDTALHFLTLYALHNQHLEAAQQAISRLEHNNSDYTLLATLLHDAYINTSIRNFHRFYHHYPNLVSDSLRYADSLAYTLVQDYDYRRADSCIRAVAPAHEAYIMLQEILKDDIDHGRFDAAISKARNYSSVFGNDYSYTQLLVTLATDSPLTKAPQPLRGAVNSPKGDEYAPVPSADGSTLFFAAKNRLENLGGEDIFVSHLTKKGWSKTQIEMDLSHTYGNEAPLSVSPDGNTLLVYQSGILFRADRTANGWNVHRLPAIFNGSGWQADASLAANGRVIIFAALGRTNREVDSSLNIYVSLMDSNGNWCEPFELGPAINTPFDERSPYLHPDMHTLYFSSEGHGSMGQMDVFMTTRLDESYTRWSTPVNIGRQTNTTGDDWGYKVSTDGTLCYFARHEASLDICTAPLPTGVRPWPVVPISGSVKDSLGKPVVTLLQWHDSSTGHLLGQCTTHPTKGTFYILLPRGHEYDLSIADVNYSAQKHTIDLTLSAPDAGAPVCLTFTVAPASDNDDATDFIPTE